MKKSFLLFMRLRFFVLILFFLSLSAANAQLNGVYTIDNLSPASATNYQSFRAAFDDLDITNLARSDGGPDQGPGIAGPVTFNVVAGHTEADTDMLLNVTGTAANPIIFQKSGAGANPLITANSTATGVVGCQNSIIWFNGSDYITFDGIDLYDNPADGVNCELGFSLLKDSGTDGCQYNVIKNCNISLAPGTTCGGSACINLSKDEYCPACGTPVVTALSGTNSYNEFYSNVITGAAYGITLSGYTGALATHDIDNKVGVAGGNTITLAATGTMPGPRGIDQGYQTGLEIANNLISVSTSIASQLRGINTSAYPDASLSIHDNTVSVSASSTPVSAVGIVTGGPTTAGASTSGTINVYNNLVRNHTWSSATTGQFIGINNTGSVYKLNIYTNTVTNNVKASGTTGAFSSIRVAVATAGMVENELRIYSNTISNNNSSSSSGLHASITASVASTAKSRIYSNTISGNSAAGNMDGIIVTAGDSIYVYGNSITNNTVTGATTAAAILNGINISGGTNVVCYGNTINNNINNGTSGTTNGITTTLGTNITVYNNMISEIKTPLTSNINAINGLYLNGGTNVNAYYNSVYINESSSGANFGTSGIYTNITPVTAVIDNLIVNTSTPAGTGYVVGHRRSGAALGNLSNSSDYNSYYVNAGAGGNRYTYYDGTTTFQTLANYQAGAGISPREAASLNVNPSFVSSTNLHITSAGTNVQSMGIAVAGFTTDFDSQTRDCPEIGVDEAWNCAHVFLPIELMDFDAQCGLNGVIIKWQTASERDNDFFSVEKSLNGIDFSEITKVHGAGTSNTKTNYFFTDDQKTNETIYYRLSNTDFDKKTVNHKIIAINCTPKEKRINFFPNPFSNNITVPLDLFFNQNVEITITDALGRIIIRKNLNVSSNYQKEILDLEKEPDGFYLVSIKTDKETLVHKAIKQK